jgi:[protein-PII] uridylyltransferase
LSIQPKALPLELFDAQALQSQLHNGDAISCCKEALQHATRYLHGRFRSGTPASELIGLRANFMDAMLVCLWDDFDWGDAELALVAVGGYGRGQLHPHSDLDVMLLLGENCEPYNSQLEQFLTLLWATA